MFYLLPSLVLSCMLLNVHVQGIPLGAERATSTSTAITWTPCGDKDNPVLECGILAVPLDYTDSTCQQSLTLKLVRHPAIQTPAQGSVLFNPGGPGISGRNFLSKTTSARMLQNLIGPQYHIVTFDPRGVGDTLPFSCYDADDRPKELTGRTFSTQDSDTATGKIWVQNSITSQACAENQKKTGSLIGTAFVARDMIQLVDALGEDSLLRYFGASYGTVLGATVAAMFPNRVDKMGLDGVVNVQEYYTGLESQAVAGADAALMSFIEQCASAPKQCAFARHGPSAGSLKQKLDIMLNDIKYQPIAFGGNVTDLLEFGSLKRVIFQMLYTPEASWSVLGQLLDAVMTKDIGTFRLMAESLAQIPQTRFPELQGPEATLGIKCSDTFVRTNTPSALMPTIDQLTKNSRYFGDVLAALDTLMCPQWSFMAKERYSGNFSVRTRNPILFVGNPRDPITPLISAMTVSAGFSGSRVLQHNGDGHTSLAQSSTCTQQVYQRYFANGTLPDVGGQCYPNKPIFASLNVTRTTRSLLPDRFSRKSDFTLKF